MFKFIPLFSCVALLTNCATNPKATGSQDINLTEGEQNKTCIHSAENFKCVKYLDNYDGDTITFDIKEVHPLLGKKISIRVSGVDTPEIKTKNKCEKKKAKQAKRAVASVLSKAKKIDLENVERGKYFRILANVTFDGKIIEQISFRSRTCSSIQRWSKSKNKLV